MEAWEKWEAEEMDNIKAVKELQRKGHSPHCACRQVWGDGECECVPNDWISQGDESGKQNRI